MNKKDQANITRKHIISVASIMFLEKGYYATSIRDIIQAAGISKGAFYHHFASKLDLYRTIIYDYLEIDDQLFSQEELDTLSLEESVKFIISKFYEYYTSLSKQTKRSLIHFQRLYYEAMIILPEIHERIKQNYFRIINIFIEKAQNQYNIEKEQAQQLVKRYLFEYEGAFDWLTIFPETPLQEILGLIKQQTSECFETTSRTEHP